MRTTLVMTVFTAFAALVLRWCERSEGALQYQVDGRSEPGLANVMGYFAATVSVRISLERQDTFSELLRRITTEYCTGYEHADGSYWASRVPRPEVTLNSVFNWVAPGSRTGLTAQQPPAGVSDLQPIAFDHPMLRGYELDSEPSLLLYDNGSDISGHLHFPRRRFAEAGLRPFTRYLLTYLQTIVTNPDKAIREIQLH